MRLILTFAIALSGAPAYSASITTLGGTPEQVPSVVHSRCDNCPAPTPPADRSTYHVPSLQTGTQRMEVREIGGEKKLTRTESWMGGSPVVYVSKLQDWEQSPSTLAGVQPSATDSGTVPGDERAPPSDGVDLTATTSAVETEQSMASANGASLPLEQFNLRLQNIN
jgi:hypothetical protein